MVCLPGVAGEAGSQERVVVLVGCDELGQPAEAEGTHVSGPGDRSDLLVIS